jgi:hypothetical protein
MVLYYQVFIARTSRWLERRHRRYALAEAQRVMIWIAERTAQVCYTVGQNQQVTHVGVR